MKNVWKGLVFGALVGAAVGLVLDLLTKAGKGAAAVAEKAREHGPEIAAGVATVAKDAAQRVRDAELPDKLRQAAHTAASSDAVQTVRDSAESAFNSATSAVKDAAASTASAAKDAAASTASAAKDAAASTASAAKDAAERASRDSH